jgi:hypothetical protein
MEAQTAAVLANAGVITPDEVRNKLIKNPDSGFNDIADDLPEDDEPFNFGEEEQEGNGETPQNPFSMDEDWKESDHPRNENGEFTNGSNSSSSKNKPSERHNRVRNRQRKPLNMSNTEKAVLRDAVARNQFNDEEKESGYATRYTSQYSYLVKIDNADLLSYTPIRRWKNK